MGHCPHCRRHFSEPDDEQGDHGCPRCGLSRDDILFICPSCTRELEDPEELIQCPTCHFQCCVHCADPNDKCPECSDPANPNLER